MDTVRWGRSVVEPARGHVREPETNLVDGAVVGFAICGAFLLGDLTGGFPKCSVCLDLLGTDGAGR